MLMMMSEKMKELYELLWGFDEHLSIHFVLIHPMSFNYLIILLSLKQIQIDFHIMSSWITT
jgi:hypothetical protein